MVSGNGPVFDQLIRNLARGGSRREFVRQSAGVTAIFGLSGAGLPSRFTRPLAAWFRIPTECETHQDCGDPCLVCPPHKQGEKAVCAPKCLPGCTKCEGGNCIDQCTDPCLHCDLWQAGHPPKCIPKCQAGCSKCENGQCVDRGCAPCEVCFPVSRPDGTCQSVENFRPCIKCDPKTGKETTRCSACEKCVQGECVSDCPNRCEICDNGVCRKCDRPCEECNEQGQCWSCDSACQRCNPQSGECETTCPGGMTCCSGQCINCCGTCSQGACGSGATASCDDRAKKPTCCGTTCHDLDSDVRNCGSCGNACREFQLPQTGERCEESRCVCQGVYESNIGATRGGGMECRQENHQCCDGDCVDTATYQSDPKHCGKCIVECEKDEQCVKGECVGSPRVGYRITYHHKVDTELRGVQIEYTYEASVRQLSKPDADGNNFAGKGTYAGRAVMRKANCFNNFPEDVEPIEFQGRLKGTANVSPSSPGAAWVTFTLEPIDPPKMHFFTKSFRGLEELMKQETGDLPALIFAGVGMVELKGGTGTKTLEGEMGSNACDGKVSLLTETEVMRLGPGPKPKGDRPKPSG